MISTCPPNSPKSLADLCSAQPGTFPHKNYTYLIDVPVYSNVTEYLYRNIYCARCHGEKNDGMIHWNTRLYCNENLTQAEQKKFVRNATYSPGGERHFVLGRITCALRISDLKDRFLPLHEIIPNVRYCGPTVVSTCPENSAERDSKLCLSYSQHVQADGKIYKNPHCAKCNAVGFEKTNSSLVCYVHEPPKHRISVFDFPFRQGPTGISLLFDFSLDSEEGGVGYDMRCHEEEIWDYLHKRCQMAVCQKGYFIQDDACHPIDSDAEEFGYNVTETKEASQVDAGHQPINSTCMRILIFESEYSFVSANNTSIIVNSTRGGDSVVFAPEEYEYWNDTTLAICARDLHEGFKTRFSQVLDYISTISMAISVTFSFLHILLYICLPKLRNLPGNNLFCLTLSLFVAQLLFLTLVNHTRWTELCYIASITTHYAFLAAFYWMNVMSFDIWRTFSGAMLMSRNQSSGRKRLTFFKYSLFAWLTPSVFVTTATIVDILPDYREHADSSVDGRFLLDFLDRIKPAYGRSGLCWINQRLSLFIFFAVPVALVVTTNLVLFSFTAKAILLQKKESGKVLAGKESKKAVAKTGSTSSKDGKTDEVNFKLYAKLALIMGLTWILGFVSNFANWDWLWYPFVLLNGLQGTFIFFAFDFKRKVLQMLKDRLAHSWLGRVCGYRVDSSRSGAYARRNHGGQSESTSRSTSISFNRTLSTSLEK